MIPVLDVARYVINYSNKMNYSISNLKLQKLLYFIQAYYLAFTPSHKPCFSEEIEAWNFGPVVPSVYHEFKSFGGGDIPYVNSYYKLGNENNLWSIEEVPFDDNCISKEDKKIINDIIDKFSAFSAAELVELTHHQAPWKDAYLPRQNVVITKDAIREYFNG